MRIQRIDISVVLTIVHKNKVIMQSACPDLLYGTLMGRMARAGVKRRIRVPRESLPLGITLQGELVGTPGAPTSSPREV